MTSLKGSAPMNTLDTPTNSTGNVSLHPRWLLVGTFGRELWRSAAYGFLACVTGFGASLSVFLLLAIGAALAIVWVGVPILVAGLLAARLWLTADAMTQRHLLGTHPDPVTFHLAGLSPTARLRLLLRDRVTWTALGWSLAGFPIACVWLVILPLFLLVPPVLISAPIGVAVGESWIQLDNAWLTTSVPGSIILMLVGILAAFAGAWAVRGAAHATATLGSLAAGARQERLTISVERLRAERDLSLASVAVAQRRIERDLHDGAQRHLVAAAMILGRMRRRLPDADPLEELVDEALEQVTTGLAELRRLVRGVGPSSLEDQNLSTALQSLAAGVPVPLAVVCDEDDLPLLVRSTAYFVASEAVANAVRHGAPSSITIHASRPTHSLLELHITDDGAGGATELEGGGIAGVRERVAALGGKFEFESPDGGPTVVRASLPCE